MSLEGEATSLYSRGWFPILFSHRSFQPATPYLLSPNSFPAANGLWLEVSHAPPDAAFTNLAVFGGGAIIHVDRVGDTHELATQQQQSTNKPGRMPNAKC